MARCPLCGSARIVSVISTTRRAFCTGCGTRWIQQGGSRRNQQPPVRSSAVVQLDPNERSVR
jgi:hypothetical protein